MKHHLICLTIDLDPDGLSGVYVDRSALTWHGVDDILPLPEELEARRAALGGRRIPITWFIRVDGQLRSAFGSSLHLVHAFEGFWEEVRAAGDELAWHPHLYHQPRPGQAPELLTDPNESAEELERLWEELAEAPFLPTAFRNGEGWHTATTYETVERLGMTCDSTAMPGLEGGPGHPKNWLGAPNQPYYPGGSDLRRAGPSRSLLEVPMTTWRFQAPYDSEPRVRYMNPAVHPQLFSRALGDWQRIVRAMAGKLSVWIFILHPDEVMPGPRSNLLYALSREAVIENLVAFVERICHLDESFEFTTVSEAANRWREHDGVARRGVV